MKQFCLINFNDMWKLTFFSLISSLNVFKLKYPWITVRKWPQKKLVSRGNKMEGLGGPNFVKIPNIRVFWTLLKSLLLIPLPPKFVCWHFLTATQTYFTLKTLKDHIRQKNVDFHISLKFIKRNCFIKLSDLPLSQFLRFLKSESFQSSRIQKSLPWTPKLLGQVIFVK